MPGEKRYAKTVIKEQRLACYLVLGHTPAEACRLAGFPESVIKRGAISIAQRPSVQKMVKEQRKDLEAEGRVIDQIKPRGKVSRELEAEAKSQEIAAKLSEAAKIAEITKRYASWAKDVAMRPFRPATAQPAEVSAPKALLMPPTELKTPKPEELPAPPAEIPPVQQQEIPLEPYIRPMALDSNGLVPMHVLREFLGVGALDEF